VLPNDLLCRILLQNFDRQIKRRIVTHEPDGTTDFPVCVSERLSLFLSQQPCELLLPGFECVGYCASNPTLYAIADATMALKLPPEYLRVLSVGVGVRRRRNHGSVR
jgi:hypothetical protein